MIGIYTRSISPLSKEFWKWALRRIAGRYSGPNAVEDSLLRGLEELQIPFARNMRTEGVDAVVLSGTSALREVIGMKKRGTVRKLIAGPNIVARPLDSHQIMLDESIDAILVPSQWVADLWTHEAPEITGKLRVWPSGVEVSTASTRRGQPVIYDKLGDEKMLMYLQEVLGKNIRVFTYGSFKREDYLTSLSDAPFLIYLSESESQGLALQEAWAHDVPTLVNKSTHWKSNGLSWDSPQINCPYLTPELGDVFGDIKELHTMIERISTLHPKQYCDEHLSDRASAQKLLELI